MDREQREQEMVSEFDEITGGSAENSRFFLESSNWNLELALASYYEEFGGSDGNIPRPHRAGGDHVNMSSVSTEAIISESENDELVEEESLNVSTFVPSSTTSRFIPNRQKITTMSTMRREPSSDEEEGQAYYAGGSEHSGQQVVGPPQSSHEIISEMFRSVKDQGGVEAISHEPGGMVSFSGQGYRLGQSVDDTNVSNPTPGPSVNQRNEVVLRLWRDGFNLNNGHLRSYNDPQEREFLSRIRQGHVPAELFPDTEGGTIHLSLEDHRNESYVAEVIKIVPFSGKGHVLGSIRKESDDGEKEVPPQTMELKEDVTADPVATSVVVDNSLSTTVIQVRLPNGERLKVVLNHSHTIGDLRRSIIEQRPQFRVGSFTLLSTFPTRELYDEDVTVEDAKILNSCIVLKD